MRVLVTGAAGLVGPYLVESFRQRRWSVTTLSRSHGDIRVDLSSGADLSKLLDPALDAVVNCVALTNVDGCEIQPDQAWAMNAAVVANLVRHLGSACHLIQISTDQVYDGRSSPHREPGVSPVNVYGRTKVAGEMAAYCHPITTVVRTNVFGPSLAAHRASLSDWISYRLREGDTVGGFTDLVFTPVHLSTLADIIGYIVHERLTGTFNVGSWGALSKFEFARAVSRQYGFGDHRVVPVRSADRPGRAPRPIDTSLDSSHFELSTGIQLPNLTDEVKRL